ncbi:MAG: NfeD family protein [Leptolyngbyaceae cyanobacterium]
MLNRKTLPAIASLLPDYLGTSQPTKGYVEQAISSNGRGRVRYQATYWFGICHDGRSLPKGAEVTVIGRQGNTLIVEPVVSGG